MKLAGLIALIGTAAIAAIVLFEVFSHDSGGPDTAVAIIPTRTATFAAPTATPLPHTWVEGVTTLRNSTSAGKSYLLSCLDGNRDDVIEAGDQPPATSGLITPIALKPGEACIDPAHHSDFHEGSPSNYYAFNCASSPPPALLVVIGSAGTDLLDLSSGESLGLIDITNAVQARATAAKISTAPVLAASALFGAEQPQTAMEQWIEHDLSAVLDNLPCLRAVLIGNSHGGVTVTSVTAALDAQYGRRLFGVLVDRTIALYDRPAIELPVETLLLNVFQTNEGWHGSAIDAPNVVNLDESAERAPIAPSDGGGAAVMVTHKTLDDSPPVQQRIEDAILAWLTAP